VHGLQTGSLYAGLRGTDAKVNLAQVVTQASLFPGQ
jgi:pilus assembly protein CpaB